MKRPPRWTPVAIAVATLIAIHSWYVAFLVSGEMPLHGNVSVREALLASIRDVPSTCILLLPAWLPVLVPLKMVRLSRWVAVVCGAISVAVAVSLAIFVALRQEWFFAAVAALYAGVGLLHLTYRSTAMPRASASQPNGI